MEVDLGAGRWNGAWELLERVTVGDYLSSRRESLRHAHQRLLPGEFVVTLDTSLTAGEALSELSRHGILSAPVVVQPDPLEDPAGDPDLPPGYSVIGWLSVGDFVRTLVNDAKAEGLLGRGGGAPAMRPADAMGELDRVAQRFLQRKVMSVSWSGDNEMLFRDAAPSTSLAEVVKRAFLRWPRRVPPERPVHRVGVFKPNGEVSDVVSMSNVAGLLLEHLDECGGVGGCTVQELELATSPCMCVPAATPVLQCFDAMEQAGVSAVGLTRARDGALVGTLSESDLRGLRAGGPWAALMALPAAEWLCVTHGLTPPVERPAEEVVLEEAPPVTCAPAATLREVLRLLVRNTVHRVYVVPGGPRHGGMQPVGVATLTDVLSALTPAGV